MLLRIFLFVASVLVCQPGLAFGQHDLSATGTIRATATVCRAVGLLSSEQLPPSLSSALSDPLTCLLMSPRRGVMLHRDGKPVDLSRCATIISHDLTMIDWPRTESASASGPAVLTLIFTEN